MLKQILWVLCSIVFVISYGAVSEEDFKEEKRQEAEYCKNVKQGIWPDYKLIYKKVCDIEKLENSETLSKLELLALTTFNNQL